MRIAVTLRGIGVALAAALFAPAVAFAQLTNFQCPTSPAACDPVNGVSDCCQRPFSAGSIVIPMDRCHQVLAMAGTLGPPNSANSPKWCANSGPGQDDGIFMAYGLVYRLMQQGITVYWTTNPTKDPPALTAAQGLGGQTYIATDIDFWAVHTGCTPNTPPALGDALPSTNASCLAPVLRLDPNTLGTVAGSYGRGAMPFRGAAFIIDQADRAAFDAWWLTYVNGGSKYDFNDVELYEVQAGAILYAQDFTSASPYTNFGGGGTVAVNVALDYQPPKLARVGQGAVSATWLGAAQLADVSAATCQAGVFDPAESVVCEMNDADIAAGDLLTSG